jgi:hypothetical protein
MSILAAQAQNPHWQWYVEQQGGPASTGGYIGFLRGQLPKVKAQAPDALPASRLCAGTGQAYLNTDIRDAAQSVQVVFKSSPFGTQSHGYESNNSFLLWAYGKRLLIYSGYRDIYGSEHHTNWMWSTRSTNCITVNGQSQKKHTVQAPGRITAFLTTPQFDAVIGDASASYGPPVEQFQRAILFVKPDLVIIYDRLRAAQPSTFEYWLHAVNEFGVRGQGNIVTQNGDVACDIAFLTPQNLTFDQTNEYDPNPRPRIKLREWHLTAKTAGRQERTEFVTVYRVHRAGDEIERPVALQSVPGGYVLKVARVDGSFSALLPAHDTQTLKADGLTTAGTIKVRLDGTDRHTQVVEVRERDAY